MRSLFIKACMLLSVAITAQTTYVPDDNFEQALIDLGYDDVMDDYVLTSNISSLTELDLGYAEITDATGIEAFVSLESLNLRYNDLTTANVSGLTSLKDLQVDYNPNMTTLDVTALTGLQFLRINGCNFTSIDLTQNSSLIKLLMGGNNFTSFDFSGLTELKQLYCSGLDWSGGIDLSNNSELTLLEINNAGLTDLDLTNNPNLQTLYADDNSFTTLDLTKNTVLRTLEVDGNALFTSIDITNNLALENIDLSYTGVTALNTTLNTNLLDIDITGCAVSNLDVSSNTLLTKLDIADTDITSIDVSKNIALSQFVASKTDISSVDLSSNINLTYVSLSETLIEDLDLSNSPLINHLFVEDGPLRTIDLTGNTDLNFVFFNNTNLTELDLSSLTTIIVIEASNSNLVSFDLSGSLIGNHLTAIRTTGNPSLSCIVVNDVLEVDNITINVDSNTQFVETACTTIDIPDNNFEQALIDLGHDDVIDGSITIEKALAITSLNLDGKLITDLTGIQSFVNLTSLTAQNNSLTALEVRTLFQLELLDVSGNQITSLDLSELSGLTSVDVSDNALEAFSVANENNTNLTLMTADSNPDLLCLEVDDVSFAEGSANFYKDSNSSYSTACHYFDTYVPDDNFEQALIDEGLDDVLDDYVVTANISAITDLYLVDLGIVDLTGLEDFIGLNSLELDDNPLSGIDASTLVNLNRLRLDSCGLNAIDISKNTLLEELDLDFNNLSSIDLSKNTLLEEVDFEDNNLAEIDLSNNVNLVELDVAGNNLNSIDLSALVGLEDLRIGRNNLTSIDFSDNLLLDDVYLEDNNLSVLDVTALINLDDVDFSGNNLTEIDLTNAEDLDELNISSNPLTSIDLSGNIKLDELIITDTQIQALDLSLHTGLYELTLSNNNLRYLNIANGLNEELDEFDATGNENLICIEVSDVSIMTTNFPSGIDEVASYSDTPCTTYVPDNNFEQALIDLGFDDVLDDNVVTSDITNLTSIDINTKNIDDVTGLEDFVSLKNLNISSNNLLDLPLNTLRQLEVLSAGGNQITALDLTLNKYLLNIDVSVNALEELKMNNGNNEAISSFTSLNNPSLACIEVDDVDYATVNFTSIDGIASFSLDCDASLSVLEEDVARSIYLSPNPANDYASVNVEVDYLEVYNMIGEKVTESNTSTLNVSELSSGVYIVIISYEGQKVTKRLLVN